ncbi:MAG: L-lactate permease, partial [Treponemataceae bacterium]
MSFILDFALALLPIIWLLLSLGVLKLPAWKSAFIALLFSMAIAYGFFFMSFNLMSQAALEGVVLALFPIVWVVFSALFLYRISVNSGGMDVIRRMLTGLSPDRRIQTLILAFAFGGFLEAVAGFGTAVAIPAGIMIAMGFEPLLAATLCLMANTIPVAFGVIGVPIITLAQITNLPENPLSLFASLQLLPLVLILPLLLVAIVTRSVKASLAVAFPCVVSGAVFGTLQCVTAWYLGPEMPAVIGSLGALLSLIALVKFFPPKKTWLFPNESPQSSRSAQGAETHSDGPTVILRAWSPFLLILFFIVATRTFPFLSFLSHEPFVVKRQFYFGPGGKALVFPLATSSGTILFVSAGLGAMLLRMDLPALGRALRETFGMAFKSIITIIAIVAMSKMMAYSGMIGAIATVFSMAGPAFPFLSPTIGALGTFLTGSDTSSNVLFGALQKTTAENLDLRVDWIVASNAAGATAGKMISPQSIAIAASSTGLGGEEGELLRRTLPWCGAYVAALGLIVGL